MKMKVLTYGLIAEKAGSNQLEVDVTANTEALINQLEQQYPFLKEMKYAVAVNHEIVRENKSIGEGDEVAILPPFAGG